MLSQEQEEVINKYLMSALRKVIREPIVNLREAKQQSGAYMDVVEKLFGITINNEK